MPRLYKSGGQYSFSTKFRKEGDMEQPMINERKEVKTTEETEPKQDSDDQHYSRSQNLEKAEESVSPTKWLSKQMLETTNNDLEVNSESSDSSPHKSVKETPTNANNRSNLLKNADLNKEVAVKSDKSIRMPLTDNASRELLKRCFVNKFKNYKNAAKSKMNKSSQRVQGKHFSKNMCLRNFLILIHSKF